MPYMTEMTDQTWKILFLGLYRVPAWVLAKIFDKDEKHIQRLLSHLGNCSLVGSTIKGQTPKRVAIFLFFSTDLEASFSDLRASLEFKAVRSLLNAR